MIRDMESTVKKPPRFTPAGLVWIKGPATLASVGLERTLKDQARCHRGVSPPAGLAPSAVVVCCPESPDPDGVASEVESVRETTPAAAVVVLGPSPDAALARAAMRAGARGFVHAGMPPEQVARAVSVAVEGEVVLPRELLKGLVADERPVDLSVLGPRQWEIVGLVAEGLSNAEIARRLYLSESTIKQHLRRAYKLLKVKNRIQAATLFRSSNRLASSRKEVNPRPGVAASGAGKGAP